MSKIQVRLLLAAKDAETFTEESLQRDIAERFMKMYQTAKIQEEFQRFVNCMFFEPNICGRSVAYHTLSASGKKITRKLAAIAADPESRYHELTQMSTSPNVGQQQQA